MLQKIAFTLPAYFPDFLSDSFSAISNASIASDSSFLTLLQYALAQQHWQLHSMTSIPRLWLWYTLARQHRQSHSMALKWLLKKDEVFSVDSSKASIGDIGRGCSSGLPHSSGPLPPIPPLPTCKDGSVGGELCAFWVPWVMPTLSEKDTLGLVIVDKFDVFIFVFVAAWAMDATFCTSISLFAFSFSELKVFAWW